MVRDRSRALASYLAGTPARMDVFVARDGASVAVRGPDGRLAIVGSASAFVAEQWLRADGDRRRAVEATGHGFVACDPVGCVATLAQGRTLALVRDRRAFEEDCRRATIVVSALTAPRDCAAALVLDRPVLIDKGAATIRFGPAASPDMTVTTVRDGRDTKPWSARRALARPPAAVPAPGQRPAVDRDTPPPCPTAPKRSRAMILFSSAAPG
jgi:competence protein ComEC